MKVDFTVTGGAPRWAEGKDIPKEGIKELSFAWKPDPKAYGQFMSAVATRYDGSFKPKGQSTALPKVSFWVIYNEPNFGQDLGPQAINTSRTLTGAALYRGIVDAGFKALQAHHAHDTILIGELAARGFYLSNGKRSGIAPQGYPGNYGQTRALYFLRSLYCIGTNGKPLQRQRREDGELPDEQQGLPQRPPRPVQGLGLRRPPLPRRTERRSPTARRSTTRRSRSWATSQRPSTRPTGPTGRRRSTRSTTTSTATSPTRRTAALRATSRPPRRPSTSTGPST